MSQHLITTVAEIQTCRRCGGLTLTGIAEGLRARVDLTPCPDETTAIRAGRWTYNLAAGQLVPRQDWHRRQPAAAPILADHACKRPRIHQPRLEIP